MRKSIIAGLSALALALTLTACSDKAAEQAAAAKKDAEAAAARPIPKSKKYYKQLKQQSKRERGA